MLHEIKDENTATNFLKEALPNLVLFKSSNEKLAPLNS